MILIDDRTPAEKKTHTLIVLGTDKFLSGWGLSHGGPSYAGWSCTPSNLFRCESWVRNRSDMHRIRVVGGDYKPPNIVGHCHIYVFDCQDQY